jgi:superoxide dismutase
MKWKKFIFSIVLSFLATAAFAVTHTTAATNTNTQVKTLTNSQREAQVKAAIQSVVNRQQTVQQAYATIAKQPNNKVTLNHLKVWAVINAGLQGKPRLANQIKQTLSSQGRLMLTQAEAIQASGGGSGSSSDQASSLQGALSNNSAFIINANAASS